MNDPLTAAWADVRREAAALADDLRENGWTATLVEADHLAAVAGEPPRLSFTVPDSEADAVAEAIADGGEFPTTAVRYADPAGHRLFVLVARDPESARAVVLAGGTERTDLEQLRDGGDDTAVETVVRRVDGTVAARFAHDDAAPFLAEL